MYPIGSDGLMKVEVNGAIHRRAAQAIMAGRDATGFLMYHYTPELRRGEVLIETIGSRIPTIVSSGL
jgi:hypothetical protein